MACQNLKVDFCATWQHRYAATIISQPPALLPLETCTHGVEQPNNHLIITAFCFGRRFRDAAAEIKKNLCLSFAFVKKIMFMPWLFVC